MSMCTCVHEVSWWRTQAGRWSATLTWGLWLGQNHCKSCRRGIWRQHSFFVLLQIFPSSCNWNNTCNVILNFKILLTCALTKPLYSIYGELIELNQGCVLKCWFKMTAPVIKLQYFLPKSEMWNTRSCGVIQSTLGGAFASLIQAAFVAVQHDWSRLSQNCWNITRWC